MELATCFGEGKGGWLAGMGREDDKRKEKKEDSFREQWVQMSYLERGGG